jgi:hypothetical protein
MAIEATKALSSNGRSAADACIALGADGLRFRIMNHASRLAVPAYRSSAPTTASGDFLPVRFRNAVW